jgi:hypothetical protein
MQIVEKRAVSGSFTPLTLSLPIQRPATLEPPAVLPLLSSLFNE